MTKWSKSRKSSLKARKKTTALKESRRAKQWSTPISNARPCFRKTLRPSRAARSLVLRLRVKTLPRRKFLLLPVMSLFRTPPKKPLPRETMVRTACETTRTRATQMCTPTNCLRLSATATAMTTSSSAGASLLSTTPRAPPLRARHGASHLRRRNDESRSRHGRAPLLAPRKAHGGSVLAPSARWSRRLR